MGDTNWAGNYTYRAARIHRPASVDELAELVAGAERIRVLGSRHAFNDIADADELVSLDGLPAAIEVGDDWVACGGAVRYGELAEALHPHGRALHNLASLPHIAVAGAIATATHGSGDRSGNLATAVRALELVTSAGEIVTLRRGDPDFDGAVVGLGALGAVTRVTLDTHPAHEIAQNVYEGLSWRALDECSSELFAAGDSVSVFTHWGEDAGQLWVKAREPGGEGFGATPATVERHPILGLDPVNCTAQLGVPGRWSDRLPHFRMGFTPSAGKEIQSEYLLPRARAREAIAALRERADAIAPVLQVSELRTVAADELWMSTAYGRDTFAIHFTWERDAAAVARALAHVEKALLPLDARPHWGKVSLAPAGGKYPRVEDFAALAGRLDPRGAFRNPWFERQVLPSA